MHKVMFMQNLGSASAHITHEEAVFMLLLLAFMEIGGLFVVVRLYKKYGRI